jgi:DEAD/DEAH box helicase domain-containing protein
LLRWLGKPAGDGADPQVNIFARHAGATAFLMVPNPTNPALEDARRQLSSFWDATIGWLIDHPVQSVACGNVNDSLVLLRYWWPRELANPAAVIPVSPGFVICKSGHAQNEPERHLAWRRWLWLFNLFQTLPGCFLATQDGIDAADYASLTASVDTHLGFNAEGATLAAIWRTVIDQAMNSLRPALLELMDAGRMPPDEVGFELEVDGEVVAEAELAWRAPRFVLLMPEHAYALSVWQANGWNTLVAEDGWQLKVPDAIRNIEIEEVK